MSDDSSKLANAPVRRALPWGPAAAVLVAVLSFVLAQVAAAYLTQYMAVLSGNAKAADWLNSVSGQFIFVFISEVLTISILWWFLRRREADFKLLGFFRRPNLNDAAAAAIGFVVYFGVLLVVMGVLQALTHINLDQKQELGFDNVLHTGELALTFVSLVVLPPIAEEFVFRGFLFGGLRTRVNFFWSMLITSVLFAVPHLLESSNGILWVAGVDTFLLSIVLCYLREKTGNLWASIGVHMLKNGFAFLLLYVFVSH